MLEFPDLFPGARVIKLEEHFRSTQPVLEVANSIISGATEGYSKRLFSKVTEGPSPLLVAARDEYEQPRFVAQRLAKLRDEGLSVNDAGRPFRARSPSLHLI